MLEQYNDPPAYFFRLTLATSALRFLLIFLALSF